jgi:hypothetical protein
LLFHTGLGDEQYIVKRGDTLFDIARNHGVSLSSLTERNGIKKNGHIYPGKRLIIPGETKKPPAQASPAPSKLPSGVERAISNAPVKKGRWRHIIVHHSGTQIGSPKAMDRYHREVRHMENGLAYHFVIGNGSGMKDGEITVGKRWTRQLDGGHLASEAQNKVAIGICLVGNFDHSPPSTRQMQALAALTKALMKRCALTPSSVKTHQEINVVGTRCPGKRFNGRAFRESLD